MHPAISINTLCLAPAPFGQLVDTIARLGARGMSPDLEQINEAGVVPSAQLLRNAGLAVATLTHRAFAYATPAETSAGRARLMRSIGVATDIGAQTIIMTTGGRGSLRWAEAAERFAEAMAPCAEAAQGAGISLGIEPTSHLYADASIVHRLTDTVSVARKAGIGVMIDLFACWFDADIDAAIADAGRIARIVQVSDYVYGDRGLPCRAVPGDGAVPLERLIPAIIRADFKGWFDLEIIGPRLQAEGQETGLRRAADHIAALIERSGTIA